MNGDMMVGIKRGSEDFRSAASNGSAQNATSNDTKKLKLEGTPSRVIHVGNIPPDTMDSEVVLLGVPFGRVTNVLVLRGKNQAFLEMADESAAANLVQKYSQVQPTIRGRSVYTQFSNHRELKTENTSTALLHQGAQTPAAAVLNGMDSDGAGGANTVLRVIIDNMICPVTLDVLYQIFSRYGKVLKIVTFTKNNTFQALIQFPSDREAQSARIALDGQNVYHSCCTLRIDFSKMSSLNVKFNNDKSRDFTNPNLPSGEGMDGMSSLSQSNLSGAAGLLGAPFGVGLAGQLNGANGTALASVGTGLPLLGTFALPTSGPTASSSVLLVTSLDENKVTPDNLFTLFGVYGHVLRVKILYSKKDCALVQMADPTQALNALKHLDKLRVFGKQIHVMPSKYQTVQMPRDGQPDAELTKDFSTSTRHRFKQSLSKNYLNCHPPTQVLHLSNIPPSASEEDLTEEFTKNSFEVKAFKFFAKDRKMALIQLPTVDDAVDALIKMHDFTYDGNNIRVSFSKSRI